MFDLKLAIYHGNLPDGRADGVVAYLVRDNVIAYSGITPSSICTSTINAAEKVIKAIVQIEEVDPRKCRIFDIQTFRGYVRQPGKFDITEISLNAEGYAEFGPDRKPQEIPEGILNTFKPLISVS